MAKEFDRKLVFEDGAEYYGYAFGASATKVCEAVFNTSPVGYQEIVTDPTYTDQLVVMTYPTGRTFCPKIIILGPLMNKVRWLVSLL